MKKVLKLSVCAFAAVLIILLSIFNCFAKGALLLDNEVSVGYNDTVTYTLYLADCEEPVTDMVAYLFFDSEYLELDKDSVDFHDLIGVNRNLDIDGYIPFNFSTISSPVDFSEKKPVISADFKVIKEGNCSIQYFIGDMDCGKVEDNHSVKEFTLSCDYVVHSVDGDETYENATPVILDDQEKMDEYQGAFINYADGKGEQAEAGDNHVAVTGVNDEVVDVTKGSDNNTPIIITVAVIVLVLVVVIITILRKTFGSDDDEDIDDELPEDENDEEE